ncbi:MAG: hypothetical protein AAGA58_06770 [Verrucomicrobiota bacterium]
MLLPICARGQVDDERWRLVSLGATDMEGEVQAGGTEAPQVAFKSEFERSELGELQVLAIFRNESPGEGAGRMDVTVGLFDLTDRPIQVKKQVFSVDRSWNYFACATRFGWSERGKWDAGTYRMRVWTGDRVRGEGTFFVNSTETVVDAVWELTEVDLYEGDESFALTNLIDSEEEFSRRSTRGIHWVIRGENPFFGQRVWTPDLSVYVFRPDGSLMGVSRNRDAVPPEIRTMTISDGIGWQEEGNWMVGEYRFEFEQGNRLVMERTVRVTDPVLQERAKPWAAHFGIVDFEVFAGSATEFPKAREKSAFFSGNESLGLWGKVVVENNSNHTDAHEHEVFWQLIGPRGALVSGIREPFRIEPTWKRAHQRVLLGFREAGQWPEGSYKLLLSINEEVVGVRRFSIGGPE